MNVAYWRDKARVIAGMRGHTLGSFMWNPLSNSGYRHAPEDQQGLAVCRACEATISIHGPSISGTATSHRCPFHYTPEMLADIDAAYPVSKEE